MALWDSGLWDTAKWSTIEATLAVTLDNVTVSATGQESHVGTLAITLEDIQVSVTGTTQHNDDFRVQLEDISVYMEGTASETGSRRGGFEVKKRKTPVKKNEQPDIEAQVKKAVNKVLGIEEPVKVAEPEPAPVDYTDQIRAMMLDAHIAALGRQVDEYERAIISAEIAAELDDEEAILFLL